MRGAAIASVFVVLGWASRALGPMVPVVFAMVALAAFAIGLWNTTPILYRPDARYKKTAPERLRWPEAAPVLASGRQRRLILCVHGFPSTPADYRKVMALSEARGWDLAAPLLPGCGSAPADLLSTGWSQYLAALRDEWTTLRPRYDSLCLVGTSMGGSLALALASELCHDPATAPAAIATIGSPAVLNAWLRYGLMPHPLLYLARMLGAIVPSIGAALPDPARKGEDGDGDWKGYLGVYPRQAYSLQVGLREMERRLPLVRCPALICHARGDRMVDFRNAAILANRIGANDIEGYVANMDDFGHMRHNLMLYDSQRDRVWKRILDFFESRV